MSAPDNRAIDYLDALRLAVEAASDNDSVVPIVSLILDRAPEGHADATQPTRILVEAIRSLEATISVP